MTDEVHSSSMSNANFAFVSTDSTARLSATEFLKLKAQGQISTREYVKSCIDRIEKYDGDIHAWEKFDRTLIEERISVIEGHENTSETIASLAGVPVGIKDIFNTYDYPTGMGSPIMKNYTPGNDARVVSDIRLVDGIIMGKTVTAEFAVHHPGATLNPHDLTRTPGTSSGGSAAAVAAMMVPVALASQTGGSCIRPASYCGVSGFKPSFGLLPRTGMLKTTDTLDSIGIFSRSTDDLALMFEVMRVHGHNYPISEAALNDPLRRSVKGRPWRVGIVRGPKSHLEADAPKAGLEDICRRLAAEGMEVNELLLPETFNRSHDLHNLIYQRSLAYYFKVEWESDPDLFSHSLQEMIRKGLEISPESYHEAVSTQTSQAHEIENIFSDYDVLIGLACADEAPVGLLTPDIPDHCLIWSLCGLPAITLPALSGSNGFPVGVQIVSRRFNDYMLLEFSRLLERLLAHQA